MPTNVVKIGEGVDQTAGGKGDDLLVNHRTTVDIDKHTSSGIYGREGNDTLEASTPYSGQTHMYGAEGSDTLILDQTNESGHQAHHVYGGSGGDVFNFTNIDFTGSPTTGRLDDFDYNRDSIEIDGTPIDLMDLPQTVSTASGRDVEVRVVSYQNPELVGTGLGEQQFLVIDNMVFFALEGARRVMRPDGTYGEERHFLGLDDVEAMRASPSVDYVDPKNYVPFEEYEDREADMALQYGAVGPVEGTAGEDLLVGHKMTIDGVRISGQTMKGFDGNDVIDGGSGDDTIYGGMGRDLLAGGIDDDNIYGNQGDDKLWGGDGDDLLEGGRGNDTLFGNAGNDTLVSAFGDDVLAGGSGNDLYNLSDAEGRDIDIIEEGGGGNDTVFTDASLNMGRDAVGVENGRLIGSADADLIGNAGDNSLIGNDGDNHLLGRIGDDTIHGGDGNDTLIGGQGDDVLRGGSGENHFQFAQEDGLDRIEDFNLGSDQLNFDETIDPETITIGETEDGWVVVEYGETDGIVLEGVTFDEFMDTAATRMEDGNPIISAVATDPVDPALLEGEDPNDDPSLYDDFSYTESRGTYAGPECCDETPAEMPHEMDAPADHDHMSHDHDAEAMANTHNAMSTQDFIAPLLIEQDDQPDDFDPFAEEADDEIDVDMTCFVATAAYQDALHPDVVWLRKFRDEFLSNYFFGRVFIATYWYLGPQMAKPVGRNNKLAGVSKYLLNKLVHGLQALMKGRL